MLKAESDTYGLRHLFLVVSIVAFIVAFSVLSGSARTANKPLRIGGVVAVASDPYMITMRCGALAAAKKLGDVKLTWTGPIGASVPQQVTALESLAVTKPDGVILTPFSPTAFMRPVAKLMKEGTPVSLTGAPLTKSIALGVIYSKITGTKYGSILAGRIAATIHNKGELLIIGANPADPVEQERYQLLADAIKANFPNIKLLPEQFAQDDANKAAQVVSGSLVAHPNLAAIYVTDGPGGAGAAAALKTAHKTGVVKLFSFDTTPLQVRALRDGSIQGLIGQAPYIEGYTAMTHLVNYLR